MHNITIGFLYNGRQSTRQNQTLVIVTVLLPWIKDAACCICNITKTLDRDSYFIHELYRDADGPAENSEWVEFNAPPETT